MEGRPGRVGFSAVASPSAGLRRTTIASALTFVTLLALPAISGAAVTIGSDLAGASGQATCSNVPQSCTVAQVTIPGRQVSSPMDGVVVRWRLRDSTGTFAFRVVRQVGLQGAGVSTSAPVTIAGPASATFDTRLPIRAGDGIGVDLGDTAALGYRDTPGAVEAVFVPPLGDGETRSPQFVNSDVEDLFNADIEADADRDGFGDETQDLCAKDPATQGLCGGPCANDRRGTEGNDTLSGTDAGDNMFGLGGADMMTALNGDDCLFGGEGQDRLAGDAGNDRLEGEGGPDTLTAGIGNDQLSGGLDRDQLDAGPGNDRLAGGAGNDGLIAGDGDDTLNGDDGDDILAGGNGTDVLSGGAAADRLDGGLGSDRLSGGPGRDNLLGGPADDRLSGEGGNDSLRGAAGNDRIEGGAGNDKIDVGKGANRASGGAGRDDIRAANRRRDRISCGAGRDRVLADATDRVSSDCERVTRAGRRS